MKRSTLREQVFKLLFRVEFNAPEEMPEQEKLFFEDRGVTITPADQQFILGQYHALMDKLPQIDRILAQSASGWSVGRLAKTELTVLRLAVYEMLWDDAVPVPVAINEAVELARRFGQDNAGAFVNAVLAKVEKLGKDGAEKAGDAGNNAPQANIGDAQGKNGTEQAGQKAAQAGSDADVRTAGAVDRQPRRGEGAATIFVVPPKKAKSRKPVK